MRKPWRMVASVAALAVVLGLGYQLSRDAAPSLDSPLQAQTIPQTPSVAQPESNAAPNNEPTSINHGSSQAIASNATASSKVSPSQVLPDDPTQFVLNDAARAKSWPKRDQAMDDYLARHHQMTDVAAGSDLITYAQWVSEPEPATEKNNTEQGKK